MWTYCNFPYFHYISLLRVKVRWYFLSVTCLPIITYDNGNNMLVAAVSDGNKRKRGRQEYHINILFSRGKRHDCTLQDVYTYTWYYDRRIYFFPEISQLTRNKSCVGLFNSSGWAITPIFKKTVKSIQGLKVIRSNMGMRSDLKVSCILRLP